MSNLTEAKALVDAPGAAFGDALSRGVLGYQACHACGQSVFPPRVVCPGCGGADALEWKASSGNGTIYAISFIPADRQLPARHAALIDMQERFRLMAAVRSPSDATPAIGDTVRADFPEDEVASTEFPVFTVVGG